MQIKLPFMRKTKRATEQLDKGIELDLHTIPEHVAIIMDGNGRWAKERGLPRIAGHKEGMSNVRKVVASASKHGIKILTLYAFSTENWNRPKTEVEFIMKLPMEFLNTYLPELVEENVQVQTIGDFDGLPSHTKKAIQEAKDQTRGNNGLILNIALNYGSRHEIIRAIHSIVQDVQNSEISIDDINEELYSSYLYTNGMIDPDLLIRTSGEQRLSNFLLWQSAYTEFWFTEKYWPDFDEQLLKQALLDFQNRKRRYGGI
ncbi:isoprenyl transferase [Radiobacillus kanasensis]|uniref:isoprenyl transferase n=1 Tax=Radiobacillus kanasensis TaxID=2844358 RepID=UPI001E54841B|nr:isoprenyl transferase [Radiobacillus kanasensis]UFU01057.1 isoprenyl transferase [Radiobacillus kanasensis]